MGSLTSRVVPSEKSRTKQTLKLPWRRHRMLHGRPPLYLEARARMASVSIDSINSSRLTLRWWSVRGLRLYGEGGPRLKMWARCDLQRYPMQVRQYVHEMEKRRSTKGSIRKDGCSGTWAGFLAWTDGGQMVIAAKLEIATRRGMGEPTVTRKKDEHQKSGYLPTGHM